MSFNMPEPVIDVDNQHRNRQAAMDKAVQMWIEAADHIKSIDEEQIRQSNQLRDQTDQLKAHNLSFQKLNVQLEQEAKSREVGDRKNRRFTLIVAIITCLLTFTLEHIGGIIRFLSGMLS